MTDKIEVFHHIQNLAGDQLLLDPPLSINTAQPGWRNVLLVELCFNLLSDMRSLEKRYFEAKLDAVQK